MADLSLTRFKRGFIPWNKTEGVHADCKNCGKDMRLEPAQVGRKKFCSKTCFYAGRVLSGTFKNGHPDLVPASSRGHSDETKSKMRDIQRRIVRRGFDHPLYTGYDKTERKKAASTFEYRDWRNSVFKRDDYTCQCCGVRGGYLEADHIKPWVAFPELRYEVSNGRTLCKTCHLKQPTHGIGARKFLRAA